MSVELPVDTASGVEYGFGADTNDLKSVKVKISHAESLEEYTRIHPAVDATLMQLDPGIFRGETAAVDLQDVLLVRRKSNLRYFSMSTTPKHIYFSFPLNIQGPYFRRSFKYGDLVQIAYYSDVAGVSIVPANFEQIWVAISVDALDAYLDDEKIRSFLDVLNPDKKIVVSKIHKEIATSFIRKIHKEIIESWKDKKSLSRYNELIISFLWEYLDNSKENPITKEDSSSYEKILDRTTRFLYHEAGAPCSLKKLSSEVFTSKRNIQYAFSQLIDMSPIEFSRLVKLNLIRRELLSLNCPKNSISHILDKYHVSNSGRFRHEYFDVFMEYPRDSAARSCN